MSSAGDHIDDHVRLVRVLMDTHQVDAEAAVDLAGPLIPAEVRSEVLQRWAQQTSTVIEVLGPVDLSEIGGPREWFAHHDPTRGYYWRRQRSYLAHDLGRSDFEIDSLDKSSDRVLGHLESPAHPDPFLVKGLVIGYVQSGKTANFSALIAKAADAGYKVVIVLSGLHNSLRRQTQLRLQADLGRDEGVGVGRPEAGRRWVWMTGPEVWEDFNPGGVDAAVLQGNEQVILVVKKNLSRLQRLIAWMDGRVPGHVPVLVIDDEADQASVNTGENRAPLQEVTDLADDDFGDSGPDLEELSPSAINLAVRQLLRLFERRSYVAYTATPFANALIDPLAVDKVGGEDLFPRDFILSLPPPPGGKYVGPERLFGRDRLPGEAEGSEDDGLDVIEVVPEHEIASVVPPRGERDGFVPSVPPSLELALHDFVLAAAGRLHREAKDIPCTMLVHTDMRRAVQNPLASAIDQVLAQIRQQWKYDRDELRPRLEARWDTRFRPVTRSVDAQLDTPFDMIEPDVDRLVRDLGPVKVLNSDHADNLDFDAEPTLKAVLVGGNKLSRGVTVEGLLVSYYVRETPYYDTLLQMGRWFGYRGSYVDLTRLYSTQDLITWFHDLATAEEELRRHVAVYDRRGLKPTAFAPKIRRHPQMQITARNKMRDAHEVSFSYDGEFRQTFHFTFDHVPVLTRNLETTRAFLKGLGPPDAVGPTGRPQWDAVSPDNIVRFLSAYQNAPRDPIDPESIAQYISLQVDQRELVRWRVLVCSANTPKDRLGEEDLGVSGLGPLPLLERSRKKKDPTSCGVITDKDDEAHGLAPEHIAAAEEEWAERRWPTRAHALRSKRPNEEGLLLIYPISKYSQPRPARVDKEQLRMPLFGDPERGETVIGYAVSFPQSESAATVEYVAGPGAR